MLHQFILSDFGLCEGQVVSDQVLEVCRRVTQDFRSLERRVAITNEQMLRDRQTTVNENIILQEWFVYALEVPDEDEEKDAEEVTLCIQDETKQATMVWRGKSGRFSTRKNTHEVEQL